MNPAALVECNDAALSNTEISAMPGTLIAEKLLPTMYTPPKGSRLPKEIILIFLAHILAPTKYYFDNEPPINDMGFYSLIQPSGLLARSIPVSKDFAKMAVEAIHTTNIADITHRPFYSTNFNVVVSNRHRDLAAKLYHKSTIVSGLAPWATSPNIEYIRRKISTVEDFLDHAPGWKQLKNLTNEEIDFCSLKHLELRLRGDFRFQAAEEHERQKLERFIELVEKADIVVKAGLLEFEGPWFSKESMPYDWQLSFSMTGIMMKFWAEIVGKDVVCVNEEWVPWDETYLSGP